VLCELGCGVLKGVTGSGGAGGTGIANGGSGTAGASPGQAGQSGQGGEGGSPASDPFAACTWDLGSTATNAGPAPTGNNSADLAGAVLGDIAFDPVTMRRLVPVTLEAQLPGFRAGPTAFVTRTDATTEVAYLTLPVTNLGADTRCFVQATSFRWLNASAQDLTDPTLSDYLGGSVAVTTAGTYTDTCLAPNETGYFTDVQVPTATGAIYSSVTSISLALTSSTAGAAAAGHLVPFQFDVGHCGDPAVRSVRVVARNDGAEAVTVASDGGLGLGPAVLLDHGGVPVGWMYVARNQLTVVAPGQTTDLVASLPMGFSVERAAFYLSFDGPPAVAANLLRVALPIGASIDTLMDPMTSVRAARSARWARWRAAVRAGAFPAP